MFIGLSFGCASVEAPETPDPKTGRLITSLEIKPSEIVIAKQIKIEQYHLIILTGLADNDYMIDTLRNMKIFKTDNIANTYTVAYKINFPDISAEEVAQQLDTQYGMKKFVKAYGQKVLVCNINRLADTDFLAEYRLTISDAETNEIYFQVNISKPFLRLNKTLFNSYLNAVADWLQKKSS